MQFAAHTAYNNPYSVGAFSNAETLSMVLRIPMYYDELQLTNEKGLQALCGSVYLQVLCDGDKYQVLDISDLSELYVLNDIDYIPYMLLSEKPTIAEIVQAINDNMHVWSGKLVEV